MRPWQELFRQFSADLVLTTGRILPGNSNQEPKKNDAVTARGSRQARRDLSDITSENDR